MTSPATTPEAVPAITQLDGISLQPLEPAHAPIVASLLSMRGHRFILDIPSDEATLTQLLAELGRQTWTLPLAAVVGGECLGVVTTALANVKSLHASITALFVDPTTATTALAMGIRHLFWTFPLHRVHAQIPDMDLTREYVDLLTSVGFVDEGRLQDHLVLAGRSFDVVTLGLLRTDFEAWCSDNEPRLSFSV